LLAFVRDNWRKPLKRESRYSITWSSREIPEREREDKLEVKSNFERPGNVVISDASFL
jgi:hypothetical protein